MRFVLRVLFVAVNGVIRGGNPGPAPHLIGSALFPAAIPQIPLVHHVKEWRKFPGALHIAVHAVGNSDKAHIMLAKHNLGIEASLQIVAPDSAHILGDHTADLSGLNVRNHLFPARAFKAAAGPAVIRIMDAVSEAMLCGIVLQEPFLRQYGI